jgi:lipopolysaccharide export system protein LptA
MLKNTSIIIGLGLTALAAAGPAAAQLARNSNAPVDITADQLVVLNKTCQATWSGSVEALQETSRLRSDVLKVFYKVGATKPGSNNPQCADVDRMEAEGSVYYVTPEQRVRSNSAIYQAGSTTITMIGDVVAANGQNVLRGQRMVINTETGQGQMQGEDKGRNKPNRVRGVFYPKQDNNADGSTPAATTTPATPAQPAPAAKR